MEPTDDPEARIRELERYGPRATELGAGYSGGGAYPTAPMPTPVPEWGAPYAPGRQRAATGFRLWWLVFALIGVAFMVVAAAVAIFFAGMGTRGEPTRSAPGGQPNTSGSGPVEKAPSGQPSLPDPGSVVVTASPGAPLNVSGVGGNRTVACIDGFVNISGVSNTVTITGHCLSVNVSGVENVIIVESADVISASGFDNQVTYRSGSPQVENPGDSNVVEQG